MTRQRGSGKRRSPMQTLRARLHEAEATLEAIRRGEVDAVVVSGRGGERTLAIEGATQPYHVLLNAMSDGAALLDHDGAILFGNRRLGEIAGTPVDGLRGSLFQQLVVRGEQTSFAGFLRDAAWGNSAREFAMAGGDAPPTPVWITLSTVPLGVAPEMTGAEAQHGPTVLMAIITDLTERKAAEATRHGLLQHLISAEDEERRRIARELHDETGQDLTALLVGLRAIEEQAITVDVQSAAQRLRGVAAQTIVNIGRLARGLHPSVLDDMGLAAAAQRHVSDYARSFGVAVDVRLESIVSHPLPPLVATTMYRILQEALTNVARHARARVVQVELKLEGTMLELVVRDDGVGFDVRAALSEASGLGLHSMRERLVLLGGALEIQSRPGRGTVVCARIPAPPHNPEPAPA